MLFDKPENAKNIMCLSFLRMNNGDIGAFYIIKNADGTDTIVLRRSADEGEDYFLVAYYHSNNTGVCLHSTKIIKAMLSEIE